MGPESGGPEINLVRAADKSGPTKRFISSDWGIPFPKTWVPKISSITAVTQDTNLSVNGDDVTSPNRD